MAYIDVGAIPSPPSALEPRLRFQNQANSVDAASALSTLRRVDETTPENAENVGWISEQRIHQ